jgi:putative endonuclease
MDKDKMICIYLLLSLKDKRTYLGSTDNFDRRFKQHQEGRCKSTKNRRPLRLIYSEEFKELVEARQREKYLKSRKGRRELKEIFSKINIGS